MSAKVKPDHIMKFLVKKMRPGNYGQVRIHLNNGEISFVNYQEDYNPESFVEHVESPVNRLVVKSNKSNGADLIKKFGQNDGKGEQIAQKDKKNSTKEAGIDEED